MKKTLHIRATTMLLILLATLIAMQTSVYAQDTSGTLAHDGEERGYYLYVPDLYDAGTPTPLVVALHSGFSSGRALAALSGLNEAAEQEGFIVVYPQSLFGGWADGRFEAGIDSVQEQAFDDVGFISSLIDQLADEYNIDTSQVNLTGMSNGGSFALRLVCEAPQLFESVAVVSVLLWEYQTEACRQATDAVNLLIIHGTKDVSYYPEGRQLSSSFNPSYNPRILGVDATLSFLAEHQGCTETSETGIDNAIVYEDCIAGTTLAYYGIEGGGQVWPRVGDFRLNRYGIDATQMIVDFFRGDDSWLVEQAAPYEDTPRTYSVYVPSTYDPDEPMPVMMLLHGRFGTGAGTASLTGMNDLAEEFGFIGLYPDGLRYPNGEEGDFGWQYNYTFGVENPLSEDTVFLDNLIDDLAMSLNIDQERIYVSGFSNGGFMVHRLACEDPHRYAAYATVAGSGFLGIERLCDEDVPVPMLIIHGTADNNVRWDGVEQQAPDGRRFYSSYPVLDMASFWAQRNGCGKDAESEELPQQDAATLVRILRVRDCPPNGDVVVVGILGGGHNWPGRPGILPDQVAGYVNVDINAGVTIWEFASQFPRPEVESEATQEAEATEDAEE